MPRTLAQNAQYIAETIKPAIKTAIENKGVTVPSTDSFLDYADRIGEISGGGSGYQLKDLPTGAISTVSDAEPLPLNALKVSVGAWQEGSGDPSPSNIRPIHGWSSGEIGVVGKNLVKQVITGYIDSQHDDIRIDNDAETMLFFAKQGVKYTASSQSTFDRNTLARVDTDNVTHLTPVYNITANSGYTWEATWTGWTVWYVKSSRDTVIEQTAQIEIGNQATTYEPYNGNTYTHAFTDSQGNPLTCYGGEWDVVDGSLSDEYLVYEVTSVTRSNSRQFYKSTSTVKKETDYTVIADRIKTATSSSDRGVFVNSSGAIRFNTEDEYATAEEMMQAFGGVIYVKCKKATVDTIPQQAESIRMLEGVNNLYADCGEVIEGEYFIGSSGAYDLYDYIESDGTQYINTGRQISANDVIKCTYMPLSGASFDYWNYVWGCFTSGNMTGVTLITNSIKALYTNGSESRVSYSQNEWYFEETITANAAVNADLYIFSYSNTTAGASIIRLYAFSINGDDYLPCKRRSDGKFGLYDVKNSTFLTDSASGNAITGGNNLGVRIG